MGNADLAIHEAPELAAFRAELRAFLQAALPADLAARVRAGLQLSRAELLFWHRALHARGWVAQHWPVEHGGTGWSAAQKLVFEDECARAGAPSLIPMGLTIVGPVLIAYGTPEQQARFLPRILDGSEVWCQGFSEPGAGSDLAAVACKAELMGEDYVLNGTKLWTTFAHWSDWCLVLARSFTGARRQEGITMLMLRMDSPGLSVRPLPSLDGLHVLNELTFTQVRVPVAQRIGADGRGWQVLKATIGHERILNADIGRSKAMLARLREIAGIEQRQGKPLAQHPGFARRLQWLEIRLLALEALALRFVGIDGVERRPETSILKISGTELQQDISVLMSEAAGWHGLPHDVALLHSDRAAPPIGPEWAAPLTPFYLFWRKASISAGTNEIQRDIVADALFRA